MSPNELSTAMNLIFAAWSSQRMRMKPADVDAMIRVYGIALADLSGDVVRHAITRLVCTAKFMPTVAEIREAAAIQMHGHVSTGVEAWGPVHKAISRHGSHRTPGVEFTFTDPITARVVASLGWLDMCKSEHDDMAHFRARFIDAYETMAAAQRQDALASRNLGVAQGPIISTAEIDKASNTPVRLVPRDLPALPSPDERSRIMREELDSYQRSLQERPLKDFISNLVPHSVSAVCEGLAEVDDEEICMGCGQHAHRGERKLVTCLVNAKLH